MSYMREIVIIQLAFYFSISLFLLNDLRLTLYVLIKYVLDLPDEFDIPTKHTNKRKLCTLYTKVHLVTRKDIQPYTQI